MSNETIGIVLTIIGMAAALIWLIIRLATVLTAKSTANIPCPNGALTPAQTWGVALGPDSNLDAPLPCMWEGDTEQTPISLAESFPAEYQYLKAKLQPSA